MKFFVFALFLFTTAAQAENWEHLQSVWGGTMHAYYAMDRDSISRSGITFQLSPERATVIVRDDMLKDDPEMRGYLAREGRLAESVTRYYAFEANCLSKQYKFQNRELIYKGTQWGGFENYIFEQICRPYYDF